MVMTLWWVALLLLVAGIVVWAITFWHRRSMHKAPVLVANSAFLERVPSFVRSQRLARALRVVQVGIAVLGLLAASVLAGRVATERVQTPEFADRDIVLCLDISGSMYEYDTQILQTFADMVDDFQGERISLSIFNSTSRTVFPLTDDYDLVQRELKEGAEAIDFDEFGYRLGNRDYPQEKVEKYADFVEGTRGIDDQASVIPDGLASCGQLLDHAETDRSRSIIFATDNEVNGEPIFSLDEAAKSVRDRNIDLYTFYPGAYECGDECFDELKSVTEKHDGTLYQSSDPNAIPSIITEIQQTQAQKMGATPTLIRTDHPLFAFVFTLLALVGVLVVGWRNR
ncbi:hypothetical protein DEO23_12550 [Brachybacterium endophyticum]|uniref:VWFA domain-containing protein n=1 Tax=Brachybacterium endophyticum TaxID=2182385 RepID=A0A2U2RHQ8_9MICO|nr:vWA domain-containing protein [Brachybacterium endophyticum]PWH05407.1 hypothetical protein DEO23_12550 [Brachybacterium endophyticum]